MLHQSSVRANILAHLLRRMAKWMRSVLECGGIQYIINRKERG